MSSRLPPEAIAEAQRILDKAARRILAEQLAARKKVAA